ncbi:MAG: aminomethyl-transferring glycine dehydrogenase subunit GcvPA [Fimbriimonadaceae bacterium]
MPYVPHTERDVEEMLATIGVDSIDDLFVEIPESLRHRETLNVPHALDEHSLFGHMKKLSEKNLDLTQLTCFLGAGIYDKFSPATVGTVISRGEFLTAYTPYQPELSQGYLQTIYEFQTMVANLYGMDLSNASMYDGATAVAEAAIMACGIKRKNKVAVSQAVHPHFRQVIRTYCWAMNVEVNELPLEEGRTSGLDKLDGEEACVVVGYPNFFGVIEDLAQVRKAADNADALMIVSADPSAMGLLKPPGEFGADIVTGEGQPLGLPMGYGGPLLGLFACKKEFVRRIPGRIVGKTKDEDGQPGYTMTLRTREQDIRREKATSNICTNEALMALAATVYMSAVGERGFRSIAESTVRNAQYAIQQLENAGGRLSFGGKVFGEFAMRFSLPASELRDRLVEKGFLAGLPLSDYYQDMDNDLLIAVTEIRTKQEIDDFAQAVKEVLA